MSYRVFLRLSFYIDLRFYLSRLMVYFPFVVINFKNTGKKITAIYTDV